MVGKRRLLRTMSHRSGPRHSCATFNSTSVSISRDRGQSHSTHQEVAVYLLDVDGEHLALNGPGRVPPGTRDSEAGCGSPPVYVQHRGFPRVV